MNLFANPACGEADGERISALQSAVMQWQQGFHAIMFRKTLPGLALQRCG